MSYATQADLENRFGVEEVLQLTDPENTGSVGAAVIAAALADAQAVVDGYLRSAGYPLPLVHVPVELVRITCDLVRYYLYENSATPAVKDRRDEAVSWLRDVATGKVSLGVDAQGVVTPVATASVRSTSAGRVFNSSTLAGFK